MANERWRHEERRRWGEDTYPRGRPEYGGRDITARSRYGHTYGRPQPYARGGHPGGREGYRQGIGPGAWGGGLDYGRYGREDWHHGYDEREPARDYAPAPGSGRDWFDRTRDEVWAWLGDDEARERRRRDILPRGHTGRGPRSYRRSDGRILEDVCDLLTDDWDVDASDVEVSVTAGEVTLNGTVDSREAKRRAEDVADSVSGVQHVQNNLRVRR